MGEPIWGKGSVPSGFWEKPSNRCRYMQWLGDKLGFRTPEDWYKITKKDFESHKGGGLLAKHYRNSPAVAVMDYFPKYKWKEWLFSRAPNDFWKNPENRRQYMKWLGEQLGYKTPEDWYKVTQKDFTSNKGRQLLKYYQDSPSVVVMDYFSEYDWKEWLFVKTPQNFWENQENHRRYMQWLGDMLGFKKPEDWYKITYKDFLSHKGGGLLQSYYQNSPTVAVREHLPEYEWKEWFFDNVPLNFWNKPQNRRRYMQWLEDKLGYKTPEDWYRITQKDFHRNKGNRFLAYYQGSPSAAVMEYFPDYDWKEWLFGMSPLGFWDKLNNRRRYMQWLGDKLGYKNPEDWYKITCSDFQKNKGNRFLTYYQSSPSVAVMEYFPEYEWKEWLFEPTPQNFWKNLENRRRYMEWLGEMLEFRIPEDWYRITCNDFLRNRGRGFLDYYQDSPSAAVIEYLPEYSGKEWLFDLVPRNFWENPDNRRRYMQWLGGQLGFQKPEDWYKITYKDFQKNKGIRFLVYYQSSPSAAVMEYFPEYNWQPEKFSFLKKRQRQLYRIVKRIFSEYDIKWDFKHSKMRFESSGRPMELDIFIPSLHLAIEYQGEQHILPISVWGGIPALEECQKRDEEKRNACKKHGITLIEVPHSWDGREDTAIEMLSQQFVKKVKDRVKGTKQIQAALKAINTYCKKKQRKSRKKASADYQGNFSFLARQQDG